MLNGLWVPVSLFFPLPHTHTHTHTRTDLQSLKWGSTYSRLPAVVNLPLFAPQQCRDGPRGCTPPPLHVAGAWRRGYTGKGVVVSVLEDGIARRHPALEPNYVSVLEEDGALWALIPANLAAPLAPERKRGERYFGLSFLGQRFGKGPPGLLV